MKQTLIVTPHSFVDLITNSSSELFICNTSKSVVVVEEILKRLINHYNEFTTTGQVSFAACFGEIGVAKYSFLIDNFPDDLYRLYKNFKRDSFDLDNKSDIYSSCIKKEIALKESHPFKTFISNWNSGKATKEDENKYTTLQKDYYNKQEAIWFPFYAEKQRIECKMFIHFLKVNGFSSSEIELVNKIFEKHINTQINAENKNYYCDYINFRRLDCGISKELIEAHDFFENCLSYGMNINKGSIMIRSASDNTIPYELFDLIENFLSANRHHLG